MLNIWFTDLAIRDFVYVCEEKAILPNSVKIRFINLRNRATREANPPTNLINQEETPADA
jgi:hypothetical protein